MTSLNLSLDILRIISLAAKDKFKEALSTRSMNTGIKSRFKTKTRDREF